MNIETTQAAKMHAMQLANEQMDQNDISNTAPSIGDLTGQDVADFNSKVENRPSVDMLSRKTDLNADAKFIQSPGDEILSTIQRVSEMQRNSMDKLNNKLTAMSNSTNPSMGELIGMQKDLIEFQLAQDLITKGTDKIVQGAQTLFKNQ